MQRWDIINALIEKNNYKSYLEIGYYKGWSFDQVNCENKTAVDPNPSKTPAEESMKYGNTYYFMPRAVGQSEVVSSKSLVKLTSDDFFEEEKKASSGIGGAVDRSLRKWDIIFIDGLHEAEQVYKDIQNSLRHLNPGGTIVLHDANPPKYEHTTTGVDGCWTGDTYKAVIKFIDNYETEHTFNTVDTDWGVGIIQKGTWDWMSVMQPHSHGFTRLRDESEWDFFNNNRKDLINLITVEQFKEKYL